MKSKTRKSRGLPLMLLTFTLIGGLLLAACGSFGVQVSQDGEDGSIAVTGSDQTDSGDDGAIEGDQATSGSDGSTMNTNTVLLIGVGLAILLGIIALVTAGSRRESNNS